MAGPFTSLEAAHPKYAAQGAAARALAVLFPSAYVEAVGAHRKPGAPEVRPQDNPKCLLAEGVQAVTSMALKKDDIVYNSWQRPDGLWAAELSLRPIDGEHVYRSEGVGES